MLVPSVTGTCSTSQPGCKQMPLQGNHPKQPQHCSHRPDKTSTQLSHRRKELISPSLLQGGSITMPADATLSYHCHCCREGVLPCQQVTLSDITDIPAGRVYCHASRCHSLLSLSLLQGGRTAMPAGDTFSYHCYCCREGVLPCRQVPLSCIIVIAVRREHTAMLAVATLSALTACCSISILLRQECDSTGSHLGYLSHC